MKSLLITDLYQVFIGRLKAFFEDPFLEGFNPSMQPNLPAPCAREVANTLLVLTLWAITCLSMVTMSMPMPGVGAFEAVARIAVSAPLIPVIIIVSVCIGFVFVKLLGSPKSFGHYQAVTILELPVAMTLSAFNAVVNIIAVGGLIPEAALVGNIPMIVASYRGFVLAGVSKRTTVIAMGFCFLMSLIGIIMSISQLPLSAAPPWFLE